MLAGRKGMSPVMIGRQLAHERLHRLVPAAHPAGAVALPTVVLVAGEAGIGKTRLLQELAAGLPPEVSFFCGHAEAGSLGRPFDLVADLLGGTLTLPDSGAASGVDRGGSVAPAGQGSGLKIPAPAAASGDQLAVAVDAVIARIGSGPAVVVFEDLHWADGESVAVFERLAHRDLPPTLLIGTVRADEVNRRLPGGEMLLRLERRRTLHRIQLDRLARGDVAAFLTAVYDRTPPSRATEALYSRTGGNPFVLEEILLAAGDVPVTELADRPLPWSLTEAVHRQLEGLDGEERRVIETASVLGPSADFDVLAAVTALAEDRLIAALRTLVERKLLAETSPDEFAFRHALVRDAVQATLLGRERRRIHRLALEALKTTQCGDLAELARHAAGAGPDHLDEFLDLARRGARQYLDCGSTFQALGLAVEGLAEEPDDLALLGVAAPAAWLVGLHDEAYGYATRWRSAAAAAGDATQRAAALRSCIRIAWELRRIDESWAAAHELETVLPEIADDVARARAMAHLAQVHMLNGLTEEAVAWADRAIELADRVDAKGVRAQALVERGTALGDRDGRRGEGEATLRAAAEEAEAVGDLVLVSRALNNLLPFARSPHEQRALLERMRDAASRAGFDHLAQGAYLMHRVSLAFHAGDRDEAEALVDRALELSEAGPGRTWGALVRIELLLEAGRYGEAAALVATHRPGTANQDEEQWWESIEARLHAARGDVDGARAHVAVVYRLLEARRHDWHPEMVLHPAEVLARAGGTAEELLRWTPPRRWAYEGADAIVTGYAAAASGDHATAVERLHAAAADDASLELVAPIRATALVWAARSLLACGRRREAQVDIDRALDLLASWPGWRRREAQALLAELAAADRVDTEAAAASASSAAGELTAREREVAALVAEGCTNGDIAKRLYISPKTASVHVSNILMKLALANRTELAAWAFRNGIAAPSPVDPTR